MPGLLLYQTSDPAFANWAIEALRDAEIPCYRTGSGYWDISSMATPDLGAGISIYIERAMDYHRANDILVKLGAVVDAPVKLPSQRVLFIVALVLAAIATLVAITWK